MLVRLRMDEELQAERVSAVLFCHRPSLYMGGRVYPWVFWGTLYKFYLGKVTDSISLCKISEHVKSISCWSFVPRTHHERVRSNVAPAAAAAPMLLWAAAYTSGHHFAVM